jgi:putative tricarboxylic transport membrane protein
MTAKQNWPELLMGLGIVFVGLVIGYEAGTIKVGPLYAKVGPAAFLWFASFLLVLCGAVVAYRSRTSPLDTTTELRPPLTILAGLAASVFTMVPFGFIPTATLIFVVTANGLGSRKTVRDVLIGVALSIFAYFVFAKGLGLRLPMGSLFT